MRPWPAAVLLLLGAAGPPGLAAQAVSVAAGRHLGSPARTQWSLGYTPWQVGPADLTFVGTAIDGRDGSRYWAGAELGLLRHSGWRWYGVAAGYLGVGGGGAKAFSAGWSGGLGYEVLRVGPVALAAEARYHDLSDGDGSVSAALRVGIRVGPGSGARRVPRPAPAPAAAPPAVPAGLAGEPATTGMPAAHAALVLAVVGTAQEVMGTPYVWGGTDANGFDCSGLIQYAYRQHGVALPRRSEDQAREGAEVGRDPFALRAGDILTFAIAGARISHVGLYIGDGRFIHSGSRGVEISTLSPTDPVGRYWWDRWVGARRVVIQAGQEDLS